jgi:hypothetical protein
MTKMRGKIPLEKKEMYGSQEGFVQNSINEDTTTSKCQY